MLRLCLRVLLLITVLSTALFTARLIGKAQPVPLLFSVIFTNPDGSPCEMPCMFGIRPGVTTPDEVSGILRQHPATRNMVESPIPGGIDIRFAAQDVSIVVDGGGNPVAWIHLTFQYTSSDFPPSPEWWWYEKSLGNTISVLGSPDIIQILPQNPWDTTPVIQLLYPDQALSLVYMQNSETHVLPIAPLINISIDANNPNFRTQMYRKHWHGFGRIDSYSKGDYEYEID